MGYVPKEDRYERMQYRRSGRSGFELPAISLGLWHAENHPAAGRCSLSPFPYLNRGRPAMTPSMVSTRLGTVGGLLPLHRPRAGTNEDNVAR
jgi:hypothetical protein